MYTYIYLYINFVCHVQMSNNIYIYIYIYIYIKQNIYFKVILRDPDLRKTQIAQVSQKEDGCNIYAIMTTMCPSVYHNNGFVATHALEHMYCTTVHHFPKCMSSHKPLW